MTLSCKEKCEAYRTTIGSSVIINDSSQVNSSYCNFHCKYKLISKLHQGSDFVLLLGEKKSNGCKVVVTKELCKDSEHLKSYLKDGMPKEAFNQQKAEKLFQETSPYKVQKLLDWYVYENYYVKVTEYDEEFKSLNDCTLNQELGHFSEKECKSISKMLLKIVFELNMNGIFHLNLKPKSVFYHKQKKRIKTLLLWFFLFS